MRKYPFIALLLFAFICMMASPNMPFFKKKKKKAAADSTAVVDSVLCDSAGNVVADTASMDSLQRLSGSTTKWWTTVFVSTVLPARSRVE